MNRHILQFIGFLAWSFSAAAQGQSFISIPVPQIRGPLPVNENSFPQLAVDRTQTPVDLLASAYVEEEYIVNGSANVYDSEKDFSVSIRTADAPYATRILVRRPTDPARFSGNVVVETLNNARDYDWAFIWALSHRYFLSRGDVYVAITHNPRGIHALQEFDPIRYGELHMSNPVPDQLCGPLEVPSDSEEGLQWDMISQLSALLRSDEGPLSDLDVENIYISTHTGELTTYVNSVHKVARLESGEHAFDGFLIKSEYARADRINRCVEEPGPGDERRIVTHAGVPVIRVTAQGDVLDTFSVRREDSDDPADSYRLWEVSGAPHMDKIYYEHMPILEDQYRAGRSQGFLYQWPMDYTCDVDINLLDFPVMRHAVNAAFMALDNWVRDGISPPRADRIGVRKGGTVEATYINDQFGNVIGGMRNVYLDVPHATYHPHTPGPAVCRNLGRQTSFSWQRLEALYGNAASYARQIDAALNSMRLQGWLTTQDDAEIRSQLLEIVELQEP